MYQGRYRQVLISIVLAASAAAFAQVAPQAPAMQHSGQQGGADCAQTNHAIHPGQGHSGRTTILLEQMLEHEEAER